MINLMQLAGIMLITLGIGVPFVTLIIGIILYILGTLGFIVTH